jgi:RNA polymerase sigma factor (TIGR02999 family)
MAAASCERIENELSDLMQAADVGDSRARHRLFAVFYNELHRMASRELRRNSSMTLTPTTLLHETFLSLSMRDSAEFGDRSRFMAYAARAMRGLIVDYLRRGNAQKRGREFEITSLPEEVLPAIQSDLEIEQLHEALDMLSVLDSRLAECVDLKFFCGLSFGDIAQLWQVSERTVQRDWDKARLLLNRLISGLSIDSPCLP